MKKIGIVCLAICTVFSANAQSSAKAQALLEEVSEKVSSYDNIRIEFKYALNNPEANVRQETRGDVSLEGEKYVLNIMGTTRIFDGEKIYTIIPEDQEINISTYRPGDQQEITPSQMLTFYKEGYNYEMDVVQDVHGRKIQYVKLVPINSDAEVKDILLGIDQQTKNIYSLIQTQDNGTRITITVKSFKTNQPLPASLFTFNESRYEDYYINRLD